MDSNDCTLHRKLTCNECVSPLVGALRGCDLRSRVGNMLWACVLSQLSISRSSSLRTRHIINVRYDLEFVPFASRCSGAIGVVVAVAAAAANFHIMSLRLMMLLIVPLVCRNYG